MVPISVSPDAETFVRHLSGVCKASLRFGEAIATGRVPVERTPFGGSRVEIGAGRDFLGDQLELCVSGLLAAGGLSIAWEEDEPTYALDDLPRACAVIQDVAAVARPITERELSLSVRPEFSEIARAFVSAVCTDKFKVLESHPARSSGSALPGVAGLDPQQQAAVNVPAGSFLLINAGAGSGKTHTLAFRIAHLVSECGVAPERCIALTFSVAARTQIRSRLLDLAAEGYPRLADVDVRTLHSLAFRILVIAAGLGRTHFRRGFSVVEERKFTADGGRTVRAPAPFVDAYEAIFDQLEDGLSQADRLTLYPAAINALRNGHPEIGMLLRPEELPLSQPVTVQSNRTGQFRELSPAYVATVWRRYEDLMAGANEIDLGGLVPQALLALRTHQPLLRIVRAAISVAFVDEYQDTTLAQDELLFLLAESGVLLNVVGDGDQTINSFAGSRAENILTFSQRVHDRLAGEIETCRLETNYRSRPEVVTLASTVIEANSRRLPKQMVPFDRSPVEPGHVIRVEGELPYVGPWVALQINALLDGGEDPSEIAVVYRKESEKSPQKSVVLEHLRSQGIAVTEDEEEAGAVRVITIHRAKGLEFNNVFVMFAAPSHFPDRRGDPEEERRLLYVAITRARHTVYVCGRPGANPDLFAETDVAAASPTRFAVDTLVGVLSAGDRADLEAGTWRGA